MQLFTNMFTTGYTSVILNFSGCHAIERALSQREIRKDPVI